MTRVVHESEEVDEEFDIDFETTYTVLECRGCEAVTLRRRLISHDIDVAETDYYPPPISRQAPRWRYDLPRDFRSLLDETYTALHANSRRLVLMGARALVDLFMNASIGDIGGFQKKLAKLVDEGYLSRKNMEILEAALDAGHAAAHRGHDPTTEDVTLVLDIVENLLQPLALKDKADELRKRTPKREAQQPAPADAAKPRRLACALGRRGVAPALVNRKGIA
jgi:Domain of unknown function (DUF4145)